MKITRKYYIFVIFSILLFMVSCKKDTSKKTPVVYKTPTIYIAGTLGDSAVFWDNGIVNHLNTGYGAYAISIYVAGNDVYVAGYAPVVDAHTDNYMATYWKNDTITFLTNGLQTPIAYGNSIFVSGNDVYVGGSQYLNGITATYWKNGVANVIGPSHSSANAVFVSGTDVYLAGGSPNANNGYNAAYWKNGQIVNLTTGNNGAYITSIFVVDGDVYATGYANINGSRSGAYWKNGVMTALANASVNQAPTSIFVAGNNVYVTGYQLVNGVAVASYWKNGVPVMLDSNPSNALSIYVYGNDVYVAGVENDYPVYWKNSVVYRLNNNVNISGIAYSIFVK